MDRWWKKICARRTRKEVAKNKKWGFPENSATTDFWSFDHFHTLDMTITKMTSIDRPAKRAKLLSDASSSSESEDEQPVAKSFSVNEEYAKRFEHNKKREEKERLEKKYDAVNGDEEDEDESSSDESEDDDGELATVDVDDEILATLQAIKTKDPRVYDQRIRFYKDAEIADGAVEDAKKEKPMYLQDYHRQNLLAGHADTGDNVERPIRTYQDEQDALKREMVGSMHAVANGGANDTDAESEDDFLVKKSKPKHDSVDVSKRRQITDDDIAAAEKDPETYLSNFMASRAWVPTETSRWQAFESDDSEAEDQAEKFEEAYNLRFEDPATANETLKSFSRDVTKYSVRRDEKNRRQQAREREREKKDASKRERNEEKARLRNLKIEEAEQKVKRIKEAAGLKGKELDVGQWKDVLDGDFDDDMWDKEMTSRFGDRYYAEDEGEEDSEDNEGVRSTKSKVKKPQWDDDIDIADLVPEFEKEEGDGGFALSEDELVGAGLPAEGEVDDERPRKKSKTKKDREKEKADVKRIARRERRAIEDLVDSNLPLEHPTLTASAPSHVKRTPVVGFRYRETSPTSFGLTARDILFADDSQLNQFAGLKKLASFRDDEQKRKDRKKFSKKQRLREWRKETFGRREGLPEVESSTANDARPDAKTGDGEKKGKKRKRSGKSTKIDAAQA